MSQIRSIAWPWRRGVVLAAYAVVFPVMAGAAAGESLLERYRDLVDPVALVEVEVAVVADPIGSLIDGIEELATALGHPGDRAGAIRAAGLSDALAVRVTRTLASLVDCHRATADALGSVSWQAAVAAARAGAVPPGLDLDAASRIRACATSLRASLDDLEIHLAASNAAGDDPVFLDEWPVVRLDTGANDDVYVNDYALLIDGGGNDVYANNAGGNLMDVATAPGDGAAKGCNSGMPSLDAGGTCSPTAAALLDLAGNDVYGVLEAPDPEVEGICTNDFLIRRNGTIGAGVVGVGILRDVAGDDRYTGRAMTMGAAHVFGAGVLSDGGGDDVYLAIRNGQGFGLVGGLGVLHDESGNDVYDWYMPAPLDPDAPNETPGAGGIPDDNRVPCDNVARFLQGTGNHNAGTVFLAQELPSPALGVLIDGRGNDVYRGVLAPTYLATWGGNVPAGCQGFGSEGGRGVFIDHGGRDTYVGMPDRANATVVGPGEASTGDGHFVDDETPPAAAVPQVEIAVAGRPMAVVWHEPSRTWFVSKSDDDSISIVGLDGTVVPFASGVVDPAGLAVDGDTLYVARPGGVTAIDIDDSDARVDVAIDDVLTGIAVDESTGDVYVGGTASVWRVSPSIDESTGETTFAAESFVDLFGTAHLVIQGRGLFVAWPEGGEDGSRLDRIDLDTRDITTVATLPVGSAFGLASTGDGWIVADDARGALVHVTSSGESSILAILDPGLADLDVDAGTGTVAVPNADTGALTFLELIP